jgi:hypothetical protein
MRMMNKYRFVEIIFEELDSPSGSLTPPTSFCIFTLRRGRPKAGRSEKVPGQQGQQS